MIAHSLSVTMLHVTAARRALQQDRDVDDAVDALEDAERLGRQAMGDIRRTVGLLDDATGSTRRLAPEPGVDDIAGLIDDFVRAGLPVQLHVDGSTVPVSAAEGLALYRIVGESLANIAKHAPHSEPVVRLRITRTQADLDVTNRLPIAVTGQARTPGRGLTGMRQRVELLGGTIDVGPSGDVWSVSASIPLGGATPRSPWCNG